ncbi:MAG: SMI1/KNR4 family protein [Acidobacteria bacterium]|nr:SMI1/KNR4 family protein [Acidobacteriota bacterium]
MKNELHIEIERLARILEANGREFAPVAGVDPEKPAAAEARLGFALDEDLKALWLFSDGSDNAYWFSVFSDEQTLCTFPSFDEALAQWAMFLPYDARHYEEWRLFPEDHRDPRIQPVLIHRNWFPCAEFNGFSTSVQFDADPTDKGRFGQIIVYQHDPDAVYFVAENFLEFFRMSNDRLDAHLREMDSQS